MPFRDSVVARVGRSVLREYKDDDLGGLAAEMTYQAFLALFPFLIALAALGGLGARLFDVANPADRFVDLFSEHLPADASSVIRQQVEQVVEGGNGALLSFGLLGAIWAASGGAGAILKGVNRTYDIPDTRSFIRQKLLALGLVLGATLGIIVGLGGLITTQVFVGDLADAVGAGRPFELTVRVAAWPVLLGAVFLAMSVVYWVTPNVRLPYRWATPGAAFFAITWALATLGLTVYVANFGSYNATYGTLGGVVVLLLWLYVSSLLLVLGAEINAVLDEETYGPTLAERREQAAKALADRARKQPGPENDVAADRVAPGMAAALHKDGADHQTARGAFRRPRRNHGGEPLRGPSLFAVALVILAALALRDRSRARG